ncbi:MAG: hypothetical protein NXI24_09640 [bacterium]|nr:hypothetical protein [bacterium]
MIAAVSSRFTAVAGACLLLFALTFLNSDILPLGWPDEALFSAPAAALAERGVFSTSVLVGLIPGMDTATLWNSPLYMVLTAGPYWLTGESRVVARGVSFVLACVALAIFFAVNRRLLPEHPRLQALLPLLLACDLTFQRAANTARMDMLTLVWFLGAIYFLIRDYQNRTGRTPGAVASGRLDRHAALLPFCAGLCTGAAALSHPIAVLLIPVALIWTLPAWRALLWGIAGTLLVFSFWLPYIIEHIQIFCIQFIAQLVRKKDILSFFGGDTGGVFKVFAAQYGGRGLLMILAGLMVLIVAAAGLLQLYRLRRAIFSDLFPRVYLTFAVVFALVLLSSEAWYPLYVGPVLLWTAALLWAGSSAATKRFDLTRIALPFAALALVGGTFVFTIREHFLYKTPAQVARFEERALEVARDCRTVYLRVRPDPYFLYRERYPDLEVLEFIPGKLQFEPGDVPFQCLRDCMTIPGGYSAYLLRRYATIDCFLLDQHDDWEPLLRDYLAERSAEFEVEAFPDLPPLDSTRLLRRRP